MTLKRERIRLQIQNLKPFLCEKSKRACPYSSWMMNGNSSRPLFKLHCHPSLTPVHHLPLTTNPPEIHKSTTSPLLAADNSPSFEYPPPISPISNENHVTTSTESSPKTTTSKDQSWSLTVVRSSILSQKEFQQWIIGLSLVVWEWKKVDWQTKSSWRYWLLQSSIYTKGYESLMDGVIVVTAELRLCEWVIDKYRYE